MKRDDATTIQELKDLVTRFSQERGWGVHHTPKNLAISIAIEAAELMEHFQWDGYQDGDKEEIAKELADVMIYALNFAVSMDIDVAQAFREKLDKAAKKYPLELFNKDRVNQNDRDDYFRIKKAYRQNDQDQKTDGSAK